MRRANARLGSLESLEGLDRFGVYRFPFMTLTGVINHPGWSHVPWFQPLCWPEVLVQGHCMGKTCNSRPVGRSALYLRIPWWYGIILSVALTQGRSTRASTVQEQSDPCFVEANLFDQIERA